MKKGRMDSGRGQALVIEDMDPDGDERVLEAFEEKLVENNDEAYVFARNHLFPELKETELTANPLVIAENLPLSSVHRLELHFQLLRWYRWKSRRFYGELEAIQGQRKTLWEILEKQDLLLLKTLLAQFAVREHAGDGHALTSWKGLCNFVNGVFMEMPSLIRSLMVAERVPPEVLSICVEFIPSLHVLIDSIPELLAQKTLGKLKYGLELVSALALKYPMAKVEAHAPLMAASVSDLLRQSSPPDSEHVFALTVLGRLCIALPQSTDLHWKPLIRMIEQASGKSFEINPAEDLRKQEIHVAMLKVASDTNAYIYRRNISCLL